MLYGVTTWMADAVTAKSGSKDGTGSVTTSESTTDNLLSAVLHHDLRHDMRRASQVNRYPRRFDAGFAGARAAVASGELGWLHTVRSTTLDPAPPPSAYLAASGGIFRDCSVHDFDAIRWVTGQEVTEVYAAGGNRGENWIRDLHDVDTASLSSPSPTAPSRSSPTPATTHAGTTCGWNCTARRTAPPSG